MGNTFVLDLRGQGHGHTTKRMIVTLEYGVPIM